jgi:hypothetical protein
MDTRVTPESDPNMVGILLELGAFLTPLAGQYLTITGEIDYQTSDIKDPMFRRGMNFLGATVFQAMAAHAFFPEESRALYETVVSYAKNLF